MTKKNELTPVVGTTVVIKDGVTVNPAPTAPATLAVADGPITFEMYVSVRGIPVQRRAGMRAFTSVQSATLAEWNRIFRSY